jgi:hypothetical protein
MERERAGIDAGSRAAELVALEQHHAHAAAGEEQRARHSHHAPANYGDVP